MLGNLQKKRMPLPSSHFVGRIQARDRNVGILKALTKNQVISKQVRKLSECSFLKERYFVDDASKIVDKSHTIRSGTAMKNFGTGTICHFPASKL